MAADLWRTWPANCMSTGIRSIYGWAGTRNPAPRWRLRTSGPEAAPALGRTNSRPLCVMPSVDGLSGWDIKRRIGPCRSFGNTWLVWMANLFRRPRSEGSFTSSIVPGSAPGTCWHRIPTWRKKRHIRRRIKLLRTKRLHPRSVILTQDETELKLFPPLRAAWAIEGRQAEVPISGFNDRRFVFGAINIATGHRVFMPTEQHHAVEFQDFLRLLHSCYRGWEVSLLLDEDPIHTAGGSQRLADAFRMELIWLPKRSPHLNPTEHLWRDGKKIACANRQYHTMQEEVDRFLGYLETLPAKDALRKAGILSPDFWLR